MLNTNPVVNYYHTFESKLGYRWLKGIKHFGYYPADNPNISKFDAQMLMNEQLSQALGLPKGSRVLDAGCGEGNVAFYLSERHSLKASGIDLLDFNINAARKSAAHKQDTQIDFQVGSYMKLPYQDDTFDGVYTMETLVHAPDYRQALKEFHRVLKPGGKLVLFEYSITPENEVTDVQKDAFQKIRYINKISSMPAFDEFEHGTFAQKLSVAGFKSVTESDITPRIMPMLEIFANKARKPYAVIKKLKLEHHFINAMSAIEFYDNPELWRYNIITAVKK